MDRDKKDLSIIRHILDYCYEIEQTVFRFGNNTESFYSDKIYRNAVAMSILQIGELAGRLSAEFTAIHSDIPWRNIRAMRNIVAHAYGSISIPDVWDTVTNDIPKLRDYCKKILNLS
jgi:uncharacterized protein with HEPN domain